MHHLVVEVVVQLEDEDGATHSINQRVSFS